MENSQTLNAKRRVNLKFALSIPQRGMSFDLGSPKQGTPGFLKFIGRLNGGEDFDFAYQAVNTAVEKDAPQPALPLAQRPSP